MSEILKELVSKSYKWWLFNFHHLVVLTDEGETIKGGTFFINGRVIVTIAYADGPWLEDNNKVTNFKFKGKNLIIRRLWVRFGDEKE